MNVFIQACRFGVRNVSLVFFLFFLGGVLWWGFSLDVNGEKLVRSNVSNFDSKNVSDERRWMIHQGSTTSTTTTTMAPVRKSVVKPVEVQRVNVEGDWVAQCNVWMDQAGIAQVDQTLALYLIDHESKCDPYADNPSSSAYGIPQSLPGKKMASAGADWETNPVTQLRWMQDYVISRYGSWAQACEHSRSKGWY